MRWLLRRVTDNMPLLRCNIMDYFLLNQKGLEEVSIILPKIFCKGVSYDTIDSYLVFGTNSPASEIVPTRMARSHDAMTLIASETCCSGFYYLLCNTGQLRCLPPEECIHHQESLSSRPRESPSPPPDLSPSIQLTGRANFPRSRTARSADFAKRPT